MTDAARNELTERREREARALRENLRRRKAQQRARAGDPPSTPASDGEEETG